MSNIVKNAGKYDKLIEIYSVINTKDKDGFQKPLKTSVLKPYACVKTTKGYALIQNNSDFEKAYTNFTIRYPANVTITRDMLIKFNSKEYSIEYLNNVDEKNIELEIQAKLIKK
jgi:head-tail adaptor